MKNILIIISLIFISKTYAQDAIRVKYLLEYKIDSTNLNIVDTEFFLLDILNENKKSYFQSEANFLKDSILTSKNPHSLFQIKKPEFKFNILKDNNLESDLVFYDYTAYKYFIQDDVKLDWKIQNDSVKTILNQKCKKAETNFRGRKYTAWFSTEILISDGPYKFKNLPGLILELYDNKNHYHFKAIAIQKMSDYSVYMNKSDYTEVTKKQFNEFQNKIKEKPSLILYNPNIQIPKEGLDKYDKTHRERNKYKNNPIELINE